MNTLSLITPVYNARATIGETFASVRQQQLGHQLEYIVVDANSTDGSSEFIASQLDLVSRHIREKDQGLYDGMNKGIAAASGDIVGIINADDTLAANALSRVLQAFEQLDIDYLVSDVNIMNEDGSPAGLIPARAQWLDGHKSLLGRDWRTSMVFPHPGVFVKRSVYLRLGLYDTRYRLCADHEFIARLIANGYKGHYMAGSALANFRLGGQSSNNWTACFLEDEHIAVAYGLHPLLARAIRWRKTWWARQQLSRHCDQTA